MFVKSIRLLYGLLLVSTVLLSLQFYYHVNEDAWISFKYARNLADGFGLVSNPGDVTQEGYSNLVLVLLLAFFKWAFNANIVHTAKIIGIFSLVSIVALTPLIIRLFLNTLEQYLQIYQHPFAKSFSQQKSLYLHSLSLIIALCIVASQYMRFWTTQGLETIFYALQIWLIIYLTVYIVLTHRYQWLWSIALLSFISLNTRPEGLMNFPTAMGLIVLGAIFDKTYQHSFIKHLIMNSLFFLLLVSALLSFKWCYFGHILANPSYVKLALATGLQPYTYFIDYLKIKGILFTLIIFLALASGFLTIVLLLRKKQSLALVNIIFVMLAFIGSQFFFVYYSGGDYMMHFRFFITHYPLFILAIVWFITVIIILFSVQTGKWGFISGALGSIILFVSAWQEPVQDPSWYEIGFISPTVIHQAINSEYYQQVNQLNQKMAHSPGYYATAEFGYIPYHVKVKGLDMMGLNQKEIAYNFKIYPFSEAVYANRDFILSKKPEVILGGRYYKKPDGEIVVTPTVAWLWEVYFKSDFFQQYYSTQIPTYTPKSATDYSYPQEWIHSDWNGRFVSTHRITVEDRQHHNKLLYGFYVEPTQIWVAPLARVLLKRREQDKFLTLEGYLPAVENYPQQQNTIQICLNGKGVGDHVFFSQTIQQSGLFTVKLLVDDLMFAQGQDILITLRGEKWNSVDGRNLSFILLAFYFSED